MRRLREGAAGAHADREPPDIGEDHIYESLRNLWRPEVSPASSARTEVMRSGDEGSEGVDEGELEIELAPPLASPMRRDSSLERPGRASLRRSRRTASDGGSPFLRLPYTGRPLCEYN